jgi:hypothetical protein
MAICHLVVLQQRATGDYEAATATRRRAAHAGVVPLLGDRVEKTARETLGSREHE